MVFHRSRSNNVVFSEFGFGDASEAQKHHTIPVFPTEIVDSVKTKLFERDPWDVIIVNAFKNAACEWVPLEWLEYFAILCQLRYVDQDFETNSCSGLTSVVSPFAIKE